MSNFSANTILEDVKVKLMLGKELTLTDIAWISKKCELSLEKVKELTSETRYRVYVRRWARRRIKKYCLK